MKHRQEIEDDRETDLDNYMKANFYELMNGFIIDVKEVYGDSKLDELIIRFSDHVKEIQKRALKKVTKQENTQD